MELNQPNDRLSRIQTRWAELMDAQRRLGETANLAKNELLLRYHGAVYRYLLGILRDETAAEEIAQEFGICFLRGDFQRVDPGRGRFRDYLKMTLRNWARKHWNAQKRRKEDGPFPLPASGDELSAEDPETIRSDAEFQHAWREELLARAWEALKDAEEETGAVYYAVLRFVTEHPEMHSAQVAAQLSIQLGKPFTPDSARQTLHRARQKFADLLIQEVADSLPDAEPDKVEAELIELNLLDYCKNAFSRWKAEHQTARQ